jgi:hypothetical protein
MAGAHGALQVLAERTAVRLAWSPRMHGGRFKDRQPESVTAEEWSAVESRLRNIA